MFFIPGKKGKKLYRHLLNVPKYLVMTLTGKNIDPAFLEFCVRTQRIYR